jgi:hypothetical protein
MLGVVALLALVEEQTKFHAAKSTLTECWSIIAQTSDAS